jgi:hemolysin activation/secretion protein
LKEGFPVLGAFLAVAAVVMLSLTDVRPLFAQAALAFEIKSFTVEGNTLLTDQTIQEVLRPYKGRDKTADDVEKARSELEKTYHDKGYPAVLVNIPEQTVQSGLIRLQVIESKVGKVKITGNRWTTWEKIMRDFPSLAPGEIIYVPDVQRDLEQANRGQDFKASPVLSPGEELGTTDVEIKVQDELPLHGNLEINDRNTLHTEDLRLNAMLRYDNLWQMDHSLSAQFQTSPQDPGEVKMYALSYTLPAPWSDDQQIAVYGVKSDSNTTVFGQGLLINGKGSILGLRYVIPLASYQTYAHNITMGLDYKDFQDATGFLTGSAGFTTPIKYVPLTFSYNSSLSDGWGSTRFSSGLNMGLRQLSSSDYIFQEARYDALGDYMYFTAGMERNQSLPWGMGLFAKLDGQVADQPLISHEQYVAGGMTNVRGYREAAALGDDALHGTVEVSAPDIGRFLPADARIQCTPFLFYDFAWLDTKKPLPSQADMARLEGTGAGLRGAFRKNYYYELDLAFPFAYTSQLEQYKQSLYFKVGVNF